MKILIVEDSYQNIQSAREQLGGEHELDIVSTYQEARMKLAVEPSCAIEYSTQYDAVLTDMEIPPYSRGEVTEPLGLYVALLAASAGVKYIGLLSDGDSHNSNATVALIQINMSAEDSYFNGSPGSDNNPCYGRIELFGIPVLVVPSEGGRGDAFFTRSEDKRIKNWGKMLEVLVEETSKVPPYVPCRN